MTNYKFTDDTKVVDGHTLHRIIAVEDMPWNNVKAGDLGGWIESIDNLSDEAWVYDDASVYGNAKIYDNAHILGC